MDRLSDLMGFFCKCFVFMWTKLMGTASPIWISHCCSYVNRVSPFVADVPIPSSMADATVPNIRISSKQSYLSSEILLKFTTPKLAHSKSIAIRNTLSL